QKRVFSSAVSTLQVATFSFGRPIGTSTPPPATLMLASLDGVGGDITGSVTRNPLVQAPLHRYLASDFPTVDRTLKGDRLAIFTPEQAPADNAPTTLETNPNNASVMGQKTADVAPAKDPAPLDPELAEALKAPRLAQY